MITDFKDRAPTKGVIIWLAIMIVMVVVMIIVGGATRLTNSGLSITEWKPITGALPPLSHADWLSEFEKYKQIPEFTAEHSDMTLKEFEFIYFWEWSHRQLGRLIGLVYALPLLIFALMKRLPRKRCQAYVAVLFLIGMQGAIGWWMVSSGLTDDRVDVSAYRLATHLGMAFIILGLLLWMWLDAKSGWPRAGLGLLKKRAGLLLSAIYLQIIGGAFVAGNHAGDTYKEWPLMDGDFIPRGYSSISPFWRNMFENIGAVQFNHRILAYSVLGLAIWTYLSSRKSGVPMSRNASGWLLILVLWQVALGIATLLHMDPHDLALAHQASASLVFLLAVWLVWSTRRHSVT